MDLFFKQLPFWKLKNREEIFNYFKKTKNWKKLDDKIINTIIDKFIDNMEAFEVFVITSEKCSLVKNNFIHLAHTENISLTMILFATTLYNTGSIYRDRLIEIIDDSLTEVKEKSKLLERAKMAYESAVKLDKYFISAYYQLAFLWGSIQNEYDEGIKYCQKGIEIIAELRAMPSNEINYPYKKMIGDEEMKNNFISLIHELNEERDESFKR